MTRRSGYVIVVAFATLAGSAGGGMAGAVRNDGERPLGAIVATGTSATSAFLAEGSWSVELPFLLPGDSDPAVSPDGYRIAFVSERDGNEEIYVADARTREVDLEATALEYLHTKPEKKRPACAGLCDWGEYGSIRPRELQRWAPRRARRPSASGGPAASSASADAEDDPP